MTKTEKKQSEKDKKKAEQRAQTISKTGADMGSLVLSLMGRDAGKHFIVVGAEGDDYVYLADGKYHKLEKPKKKKRKHIRQIGKIFSAIAQKLQADKKVFDSEVYSAIKKETSGENEQAAKN